MKAAFSKKKLNKLHFFNFNEKSLQYLHLTKSQHN